MNRVAICCALVAAVSGVFAVGLHFYSEAVREQVWSIVETHKGAVGLTSQRSSSPEEWFGEVSRQDKYTNGEAMVRWENLVLAPKAPQITTPYETEVHSYRRAKELENELDILKKTSTKTQPRALSWVEMDVLANILSTVSMLTGILSAWISWLSLRAQTMSKMQLIPVRARVPRSLSQL